MHAIPTEFTRTVVNVLLRIIAICYKQHKNTNKINCPYLRNQISSHPPSIFSSSGTMLLCITSPIELLPVITSSLKKEN